MYKANIRRKRIINKNVGNRFFSRIIPDISLSLYSLVFLIIEVFKNSIKSRRKVQ